MKLVLQVEDTNSGLFLHMVGRQGVLCFMASAPQLRHMQFHVGSASMQIAASPLTVAVFLTYLSFLLRYEYWDYEWNIAVSAQLFKQDFRFKYC